MKTLSILGSTGSIGRQSLEVVSAFPDKFSVLALSAGRNIALLAEQITTYHPKFVCVQEEKDIAELKKLINTTDITLLHGLEGLKTIASHPENDILLVAIFGTAALLPTYLAIEAGTTIALACKEVLVSAGDIIMPLAKEKNVEILPVDSEHAAAQQCLVGKRPCDIHSLTLTASGGPFSDLSMDQFPNITPEMALKHPNWVMGAKITIDSATLMNKGLEVIEAHHLFQLPYSQIHVLVHRQSLVHAMVEFKDGHVLSQMGPPDMRFPIQYALSSPEMWPIPWPRLNLEASSDLCFSKPDLSKFPLLKLAYEAGEKGGTAPAVLNAANEANVHLFLSKKIGFTDIYTYNAAALESTDFIESPTLDEIIQLDAAVKERCLYAF